MCTNIVRCRRREYYHAFTWRQKGLSAGFNSPPCNVFTDIRNYIRDARRYVRHVEGGNMPVTTIFIYLVRTIQEPDRPQLPLQHTKSTTAANTEEYNDPGSEKVEEPREVPSTF